MSHVACTSQLMLDLFAEQDPPTWAGEYSVSICTHLGHEAHKLQLEGCLLGPSPYRHAHVQPRMHDVLHTAILASLLA